LSHTAETGRNDEVRPAEAGALHDEDFDIEIQRLTSGVSVLPASTAETPGASSMATCQQRRGGLAVGPVIASMGRPPRAGRLPLVGEVDLAAQRHARRWAETMRACPSGTPGLGATRSVRATRRSILVGDGAS
jgi:hypothetical protein